MANLEEHQVTYGDGKQVFYYAAGPTFGPLLIFMHGWPSVAKLWHVQLETFAALGFRVVAPDMPGYGRSTSRKVHADYVQEKLIEGMLAVLADTGREEAVWIGHDWGSGVVWSLANTHPEVCVAVAALCLPYRMLEVGLDELMKNANREIYPEHEFPFAQWSYIVYYEQDFDKATEWFEKDGAGVLKALYKKGRPHDFGKPLSFTSNVVKDGGWFGGIPKPPSADEVPSDDLAIDHETLDELVSSFKSTGWFGPNSWYMHSKENWDFNTKHSAKNGRLEMPVLFVHATYDTGPESIYGKYNWAMRKLIPNLTETGIDSGHWVMAEASQETNAAISRWLVEEVTEWWPGYWRNGFVRQPERKRG